MVAYLFCASFMTGHCAVKLDVNEWELNHCYMLILPVWHLLRCSEVSERMGGGREGEKEIFFSILFWRVRCMR